MFSITPMPSSVLACAFTGRAEWNEARGDGHRSTKEASEPCSATLKVAQAKRVRLMAARQFAHHKKSNTSHR